jgi:hypothetical protein
MAKQSMHIYDNVVCPFIHVAFHGCKAVVVSLVTKIIPCVVYTIQQLHSVIPKGVTVRCQVVYLSITLQNSQGKEAKSHTDTVTP